MTLMTVEENRRPHPRGVQDMVDCAPMGIGLLLVISLSVLTLAIDGVDTQLVAFGSPIILREWHADKLAFAPVFAAALAGMAVGALAGGALGDRFGRRTVVIASTAAFGLCTLLVAFATSVEQMAMLRLLSGLGFGAVLPNIFALIAEWVPRRLRPVIVTISTIGVPIGGMMGAAVFAWAMPRFGWRECFAGAALLTLAYCALLIARLPESPSLLFRRGRQDALAESLRRVLGNDGAELLAVATPEPVSAPREGPGTLLSRSFLRRTIGLSVIAFAAGYLGFAFANWVPVMLSMAGMPLRFAILGSFFINLFAIVGALAMAGLIPWLGSRLALCGSLLLFAAGTVALSPILTLATAAPGGGTTALAMAALSVIGYGIGALASSSFTLAVHAYPASIRATGGGLSNALNRTGALLTPFVGAWLLDAGGDRSDRFMVSVLLFIAIALAGALIYDTHVGREAPAPPD